MSSNNKRNSVIEFGRFLSAMAVALLHFMNIDADGYYLCMKGALGVEFFFIISGVFLAKSAYKVIDDSNISIGRRTFDYSLKRISSLYFPFFTMWVITFITKELISGASFSVKRYMTLLLRGIPELLLLKDTAMDGRYIMGLMWYVSALIFVGAAVYALVLKFKDSYVLIAAPIIAFYLLGFLSHEYSSLRNPELFIGVAFKCTYRAIAEINLGVFLYGLSGILTKYKPNAAGNVLLSAFEIVGYICFFFYVFAPIKENYDFPVFLLLSISMLISITFDSTLLERIGRNLQAVGEYCGKMSLYIYFSHFVFAKTIFGGKLLSLGYSKKELLAPYIATILIAAFILMNADKRWKQRKWHLFSLEKQVTTESERPTN